MLKWKSGKAAVGAVVALVAAGGLAYGAAQSEVAAPSAEVMYTDGPAREEVSVSAAAGERGVDYAEEHARLIAGALARDPIGAVSGELYMDEHLRLIQPVLVVEPVPAVDIPAEPPGKVASAAGDYIEEHGRLLAGTGAPFSAGEPTAAAAVTVDVSLPWYAQEHDALIRGMLPPE